MKTALNALPYAALFLSLCMVLATITGLFN